MAREEIGDPLVIYWTSTDRMPTGGLIKRLRTGDAFIHVMDDVAVNLNPNPDLKSNRGLKLRSEM